MKVKATQAKIGFGGRERGIILMGLYLFGIEWYMNYLNLFNKSYC